MTEGTPRYGADITRRSADARTDSSLHSPLDTTMTSPSPRAQRRPQTPVWAFAATLACLGFGGGCSTAMRVSPAAEAAFRDDRPIEGSTVAMTVGGIACPQ